VTGRLVLLLALLLTACASTPRQPPRSLAVPTAPAASPTAAAPISLPRDDAPHDQLTEWWYYTGHLDAAGGASYGFELVVFQSVRGRGPVGYAARFAVSDPARGRFTYDQRTAVGSQIGRTEGFDLAVGDWRVQGSDGRDRLSASMPAYAIELALRSAKPPALHDRDGLVSFGPAGDSYYYSRTRMDVAGTLTVDGRAEPVSGQAWFDHQWGNFVFAGGGWDWFSLQLDDNTEIVGQVIRDDLGQPIATYGTYVEADGRTVHLGPEQFEAVPSERWTSPTTGVTYETRWRVRVPDPAVDLDVRAVLPNQELDTRSTTGVVYWEGAVRALGTRDGRPVAARGYVELAGRQPALR
jgi:predicted secreted hydrolase